MTIAVIGLPQNAFEMFLLQAEAKPNINGQAKS